MHIYSGGVTNYTYNLRHIGLYSTSVLWQIDYILYTFLIKILHTKHNLNVENMDKLPN